MVTFPYVEPTGEAALQRLCEAWGVAAGGVADSVANCGYIYIYVFIHVHIHIHVYIDKERKKERGGGGGGGEIPLRGLWRGGRRRG